MKHRLTYLLLALFTVGCNGFHEFPDENPVDPTLVQMKFSLEVDPGNLLPGNTPMAAGNTKCDIRWTIEVLRNEFGENRIERFISTCRPSGEGFHAMTIPVSLNAAKYKVAVWADFVDAGATCDKYYLTDALSTIRIATPYQGSCENKDAFSGSCELDLTAYRDQWNAQVECPITLQCPMARIELIANDFDKFIQQEAAKSGRSLSDLKVNIAYGGYFPSGFNAFTDKANDAHTGISFDSTPTLLPDGKVLLGHDYVFVNGEASNITAHITISDAQGQVINRIEGLRIPVERGNPSSVADDFLTHDFNPGVGIDPGFDGDIDVTIPD